MYNEPLIETLLAHPLMQRLKHIDQSGPNPYFDATIPRFSRFEHSLGVYALVKASGGSIQEQAAALLHDASHSAFSHLIDVIKGVAEGELSYQDIVHLDFLKAMDVEKAIHPFNIDIADLDAHKKTYTRLEQPLPELCADRIQYILFTGWRWQQISYEQMNFVVEHLHFKDDRWYLDDKDAALILGNLSVYFTRTMWGAAHNFALYHYFSKALLEGLKENLFTEHELEYGTDEVILDKLKASQSATIQYYLTTCSTIHQSFRIVDVTEKHDIIYRPKCRGVNPWVLSAQGTLQRLTQIDAEYAQQFEELKIWCAHGTALQFLA